MKISVIIPAYNEEHSIGNCLKALAAQTEKADEIIVVDNNCKDRTVEIARAFGARIIKEPNQGMIYARNAGFNAALYEIVARTDSDTILPPDWIAKIKKAFEDPELGAYSGPNSYFKNPLMSKVSSFAAYGVFYVIGLLMGHPPMLGPNMAIRKTIWEKMGKNVCLKDCDVHEDLDLSIHISEVARIRFDKNFIIRTTRGRWSKIFTEYVVRLVRMLIAHRNLHNYYK